MKIPQAQQIIDRIRREIEPTATRAANGVKYLSGADFATPQPTPRDLVWHQGKVELWRYRNDDGIKHGPPVLLMLGLVSRSSLFDLYEKASLVRALRDSGFDVFVLNWGTADAGDAKNTLETYVDKYIPRAIRALVQSAGTDDCTLVGYCMGGNLALLALASHPELPVANLVTMATAVDWDQMQAQVDPLRAPSVSPEWFTDDSGCVPGEVIAQFFQIRRPTADLTQLVNLIENLDNPSYIAGHQAIARWTSDHVPMPRGVARQVLDQWLRQNAFTTGRLTLNGQPVDLRAITCPIMAVLTARDEVVPPDAARPIRDVVGSADVEILELDAGHIGLAVGRSAHKILYPRLIEWLVQHGYPKDN